MSLKLVKSGEPEADAETVEMIARAATRMAEAVKTDGFFWVVTGDGEDVSVAFHGGKLESSTLALHMALQMQREAAGLE